MVEGERGFDLTVLNQLTFGLRCFDANLQLDEDDANLSYEDANLSHEDANLSWKDAILRIEDASWRLIPTRNRWLTRRWTSERSKEPSRK